MSVNYDTMTIIGSVERDLKSFGYPIDLLKVVGQHKKYSPNDLLMVIYRGRKDKKSP